MTNSWFSKPTVSPEVWSSHIPQFSNAFHLQNRDSRIISVTSRFCRRTDCFIPSAGTHNTAKFFHEASVHLLSKSVLDVHLVNKWISASLTIEKAASSAVITWSCFGYLTWQSILKYSMVPRENPLTRNFIPLTQLPPMEELRPILEQKPGAFPSVVLLNLSPF